MDASSPQRWFRNHVGCNRCGPEGCGHPEGCPAGCIGPDRAGCSHPGREECIGPDRAGCSRSGRAEYSRSWWCVRLGLGSGLGVVQWFINIWLGLGLGVRLGLVNSWWCQYWPQCQCHPAPGGVGIRLSFRKCAEEMRGVGLYVKQVYM